MQQSTFHIAQMDCPSEEQLVRMALNEAPGIRSLRFDLENRQLVVVHDGQPGPILERLQPLNLGSSLQHTVPAADEAPVEDTGAQQRLLRQVLFINLLFFVLELGAGILSQSMGLTGDSLDMLADSLVYGLALYAAGGTAIRKKQIARTAGYLQAGLALLGFAEVIRRFAGAGGSPDYITMMWMSALAAAGNGLCLYLLQKSRSTEAHMRASMIFTSNDVIINLGVIVAGLLVLLSGSPLPDLLAGAVVFVLVARGAMQMLKLSR